VASDRVAAKYPKASSARFFCARSLPHSLIRSTKKAVTEKSGESYSPVKEERAAL